MKCPEGSYENTATKTCDCHSTCATCGYNPTLNKVECTKCVSKNGVLIGSECQEGVVCPPEQYADPDSNTCKTLGNCPQVASSSGAPFVLSSTGNTKHYLPYHSDLDRACVAACPTSTIILTAGGVATKK